ncbi:cytidine deaminase [Aeromicrobium sp. YIM 150415]|uniref:cytidine deaminase n=1 Tax=Aeromicrobium sp. YIM 150415 TaxID=2803912 RepID=UPI001963570A|nr:cytidine deaminase [Aeromicrobium sp. YIM 150415]MBM9465515.1 cytidine deaminase [Aeromicrobium sp. YIM 150415]
MSAGFGFTSAAAPVDWDALTRYATEVMGRAYAPYSSYRVGAAGLVEDGRVVLGCNVENAAYGVALCAECGMISALHSTGGGRLRAVVCVDGQGQPIMPCGRCRQLIWEHGGAECQVLTPRGPVAMSEVLPDAFDETDLQQ